VFDSWQLNIGASIENIRDAELLLGCLLPVDYAAFLRTYDGGEGIKLG